MKSCLHLVLKALKCVSNFQLKKKIEKNHQKFVEKKNRRDKIKL